MNKNNEYIAYQCAEFTIEWYYDNKSKSEVLDYYCSLSKAERIQLLKLFKRMGDSGQIMNKTKFRSEGDKIFAFKPQPERFLCFFYDGKKIIVTNGFRKKQDKLPPLEKQKALKKRSDFINRLKAGDYYE